MIGAAYLGAVAAASRVAASSGHKHWRIYFPNEGLQYVRLASVEMYGTVDGANLCTVGTPTASSSEVNHTADHAFDGNLSTYWTGSVGSDQAPHWIAYEFASGVEIVQFKLVAHSLNYPSTCKLQWSDDGATWTDASDLFQPCVFRGTNKAQTYLAGGTSSYWRLYVTAASPGSTFRIADMQIRSAVGGADLTQPNGPARVSGALSNASSDLEVFDNDTATRWTSPNANPHWVWYAFGKDIDIAQIAITVSSDGAGPKDFKLQKSGDGSTWVDALTVTGQVGWGAFETRLFNV